MDVIPRGRLLPMRCTELFASDATKPLAASEMKFKRTRVPGEESIDVAKVVDAARGADWQRLLGESA